MTSVIEIWRILKKDCDIVRHCEKSQRVEIHLRDDELYNGKDEYQLQVPDEMMRWKKFETGVEDSLIVNNVIHDLKAAKKAKKDGKDYLTNLQIGMVYGITEQDVENIDKAKKDADDLKMDNFLLSGNTYTFENGDIGRNFSRAGVIMVEAIEEAYERLNFNVKITGEYLCGTTWGECH